MRNEGQWTPTKYVVRRGRLRASLNPHEVSPASFLMATRIAAFYAAMLPTYASGRLLDLGCGKAPLYATYRPHVSDVTCIDWAESLHHNPHLDTVHDISTPLPVPSDEFDTVILSDVLEHMHDPGALLDEIVRVLRPGGRLLLNVPFLYWVHEQPHDYHRYTEFALRKLLADRQFTIREFGRIGGAGDVVADVLGKVLARIPRVGGVAALGLQASAERLLRARATRTGHDSPFPLGYALVAQLE